MRDMTNLHPGDEIEGFRIGEKLYQGGMAVLYRVAQEGEIAPMLMKVPRLEFGSHPGCLVGFEIEQMILSALGGSHVPRLIAKGNLNETPYLVMEYIQGETLESLMRKAPLPVDEAVRLGAALALAVHDLHRQEVIHLDIKPTNVLYRPGGEAVLVDFGLAHHGHFPDLVEEAFHQTVGSSAYLSPEQIVGNRCDPHSDLFAIGVILYQLCTGRLPFGEPTTLGGVRRRLYLDPLPPRCLAPKLPCWMQEIILHCLEVDVEKRYATASQIAFDLSHPEQVPLTERASRLHRADLSTIFRRWWRSLHRKQQACTIPTAHLEQAPQIMVAIDPSPGQEPLLQEMQVAVRRAVGAEPRCRVLYVTVLELDLSTEQEDGEELSSSLYTQRLIELRHWASAIQIPSERVRFHVLEGAHPAAALVDYARKNQVDQIILGARGSSALRRILGSVSARVVTEAPCTVTVVRSPRNPT